MEVKRGIHIISFLIISKKKAGENHEAMFDGVQPEAMKRELINVSPQAEPHQTLRPLRLHCLHRLFLYLK